MKVHYVEYPVVHDWIAKTPSEHLARSKLDLSKNKQDMFLEGPLYVRWKIFVEEQGAKEETEIDEHDPVSVHISLIETVDGEDCIIGSVRLLPVYAPVYSEKGPFQPTPDNNKCYFGKLGRMAILPEFRGRQLGKDLVKACEDYTKQHFRSDKIILDAQKDKVGWYTKQGYIIDDTVPEWTLHRYRVAKDHVRMYKILSEL